MKSLSRHNKIQETENLIRESLLCQLSYSVKEIQLMVSKKDEIFSTNEACNSLTVVLEAIFLHGLKRGILKSALRSVSIGEESKPQPSFWNMVCNYTHKDTVTTIKKLSQITTDVGRCRVWIRKALNEAELTSYFTAMEKDRRALNSCYSNHAFLRDRETCETACKFLEGIISVQFEIPLNSGILNTWNSEPLLLSGIWSPAMKTPLSTGVDVAEKIEDDEYEDDSCSIKTSSSLTTLSTILALDETQALKMILEAPAKKLNKDITGTTPTLSTIKYECDNLILEEEEEDGELQKFPDVTKQDKNKIDVMMEKGNSLGNTHGWSSTDEMLLPPKPCVIPEKDSRTEEVTKDDIRTEDATENDVRTEEYSHLLEKFGISPNKVVNYEDKFQEVMKINKSEEKDSVKSQSEDSNSCDSYNAKLYKIVREVGLKVQKYTCAKCQVSIGLTFGEAKLCYFTGKYYCNTCHLNEVSIIPSRLIFNWDHKKYPICADVRKYLNDVCSRLLIDIKNVNPKLYCAVPEMKKMREIRIQLNMLRAYLYTCKEPVLIELQKKVTPREYIYEFIDHYSINDLCRVPGGTLASELSAIVSFGRNHVINCWLCSQKGFICEICKNSKVIYPFDVSTTYRCNKCFAIYHDTCLSSSKNCPKCIRLKSRTSSQSSLPRQQEEKQEV